MLVCILINLQAKAQLRNDSRVITTTLRSLTNDFFMKKFMALYSIDILVPTDCNFIPDLFLQFKI